MIPPLSLRLGLSAISEGERTIASGQVEPGLRLIRHGLDYLEAFLPIGEDWWGMERSGEARSASARKGAVERGREWRGTARHGTQSTREI